MVTINLGTWNVNSCRYCFFDKTEDTHGKRMCCILRVIGDSKVDILALQEHRVYPVDRLSCVEHDYGPEFKLVKPEPTKGMQWENTILYRDSLFRLLSRHKVSLGTTTRGRRTYALVARLEHKSTGLRFWVFNTHLGTRVRIKQHAWVLLTEAFYNFPVWNKEPWVLVGDINATPKSTIYKTITFDEGVQDSVTLVDVATRVCPQEYLGYTRDRQGGKGSRIDYIFTDRSGAMRPLLYTTHQTGLSDHRLVMVKLLIR